MPQSFPSLLPFLSFALLAIACALSAEEEKDKNVSRLERRSEKLGNSIEDIQAKENSMIPAEIMKSAKGLIILRQYEAGVIFGAKGGFGIAMRRNPDGAWSPPAWVKTGEISGGIQLGAHKLNVVLVIVTDEALRMLDKAKFQIGVDASVTSGPTGANIGANIADNADILAYTVYEGYYAGATFEGGFLLPDRKSNEISYQEKREVSEILKSDSLVVPDYFNRILRLVNEIESGIPAALEAE